MKKIYKYLSVLLVVLMLLSTNSASVFAAAENGIGTQSSPYIITTAEELQNINDDVTAHYKLGANIDLQEMDFTPIGNTDTGAFTGSFDGNGYTISNLNVFAGKYAGLFGYNEGTVKNVTLSEVFVYGTRYVGAVVAYNSTSGVIKNCSVLSGDVESDGGLNTISAGGICGENQGTINGKFSNAADITVNNSGVAYAAGICANNAGEFNGEFENSGDMYANCADNDDAYAGGILALSSSTIELTANNSGEISSSSYSGGIGALFSQPVKLINCCNTGSIKGIPSIKNSSTEYFYYLGGIGGCFKESTEFENCHNYGSVVLDIKEEQIDRDVYIGGLGAYFELDLYLNNCINNG